MLTSANLHPPTGPALRVGEVSAAPTLPEHPAVVCVRGPSGSGKTALIEQLIARLTDAGLCVAYVKRTHHALDLPAKGSGRVWAAGPAAMVIHGVDRVQVTLPPGEATAERLLAWVPPEIDVVLFETHTPERYPTVLASAEIAVTGEQLIGRWALASLEADATRLAATLMAHVPSDRALARGLRAARALHGGHGCAGLILGTRLALTGAAALGVDVPDRMKRLIVHVETDRCAVDGVQAVTGCSLGKRTLRLLDYGKLSATFFDLWSNVAVRVSARSDLRERVHAEADFADRHEAQRRAYVAMSATELFDVRPVLAPIAAEDVPGPPRGHVRCAACGEEVSGGREVAAAAGSFCRPCVEARS